MQETCDRWKTVTLSSSFNYGIMFPLRFMSIALIQLQYYRASHNETDVFIGIYSNITEMQNLSSHF